MVWVGGIELLTFGDDGWFTFRHLRIEATNSCLALFFVNE